jgi:hypothetical protein
MARNKFAFTDANGHEWDMTLTLATHARLRKYEFDPDITTMPVSLIAPSEEFIAAIVSNAAVLFDVIPAILKPQIDEVLKDVPEEDRELKFLSGVTGEVIPKAREAFIEALGFFCPDSIPAIQRYSKLREKEVELAAEKMAKMEPKIYAKMEAMMEAQQKQIEKELQNLTIGSFSESSPGAGSAGKKRKT